MLARANRVKTPDDFRRVLRRGRRAGGRLQVTHTLRTDGGPVRFGFVVGRGVGNAVVRNRVKRRMRAVGHELLPRLPEGTDVVLRALPSAAVGSFPELRADVRATLEKAGTLR